MADLDKNSLGDLIQLVSFKLGEEEFGMSPLKHFQKVRKWIRARESGEAAQP